MDGAQDKGIALATTPLDRKRSPAAGRSLIADIPAIR